MPNIYNTKKHPALLHIIIRKCKMRNVSIRHLSLVPFSDLEREKTCNCRAAICWYSHYLCSHWAVSILQDGLCCFASFLQITLKQEDRLNAIHNPKCMGKWKCLNLFALFGQPIHHICSGTKDEEASQKLMSNLSSTTMGGQDVQPAGELQATVLIKTPR